MSTIIEICASRHDLCLLDANQCSKDTFYVQSAFYETQLYHLVQCRCPMVVAEELRNTLG